MKHSPMPPRRTPLSAPRDPWRRKVPPPSSRGRLERAAAARRTAGRKAARRPDLVPAAIRALLLIRARGRCEVCRAQLAEGWNVHHRLPKGMGGSTDPDRHCPSRLLALCGTGTTGCHGDVESHRAWAREHGYLVRRGQDPALVPVRLPTTTGWRWLHLDPHGTYAEGPR